MFILTYYPWFFLILKFEFQLKGHAWVPRSLLPMANNSHGPILKCPNLGELLGGGVIALGGVDIALGGSDTVLGGSASALGGSASALGAIRGCAIG